MKSSPLFPRAVVRLTPVLVFVLSGALLAGCSRSKSDAKKTRPVAPTEAVPVETAADDTLRVLAHEGYISPKIFEDFAKEGQVKVHVDTFTTDEEFDKKWKDGEGGYDLVLPSQYKLLEVLGNELAEPLDKKELPRFGNLDPKLLGPHYDKDNKFTVPVMQQPMVVLAVRTDKVAGPVKGIDALLDEKNRGKVAIADQSEPIGSALLLYLGVPLSAPEADGLAKLKDFLLKHKLLDIAEPAEKIVEKLKKGDVWVALVNYGDALALQNPEDQNIRLVVPETGTPVWVESLAVVKDSPRAALAHSFVNYLLDPDVSLQNTTETTLATVNTATRAKLEAKLRDDLVVYPPPPPKAKTLADWGFRLDRDTEKLEAIWKEAKGKK